MIRRFTATTSIGSTVEGCVTSDGVALAYNQPAGAWAGLDVAAAEETFGPLTWLDPAEGTPHHYLSTACWHELNEGKPHLHASCRASCKFAEGEPEYCTCPNHPENDGRPAQQSWVDQARDIARQLYEAFVVNVGYPPHLPEELQHRIWDDPDLFWLRGEEQPPGAWTRKETPDA